MRRVYRRLITNKSSGLNPTQLLIPNNIDTFKQYRYKPYTSIYTANHPNMQKWIQELPTTSTYANDETQQMNHRWWINRHCLTQIQQTIRKNNWWDIHLFGRTWLLPHVTPHVWSAFHLMHIYKEGDITATEWYPSPHDFGESIMKYKGIIHKDKREHITSRIGWNSLEI